MTGACYRSRCEEALRTVAGMSAEFINMTSRENDPFDFLFERLIRPPRPGDRALGLGVHAPNAVTIQLDCADTLAHIARIGVVISAPQFRVCHWSSYMRPGVLRFYSNLLRDHQTWSLDRLRQGLPPETTPRWSRLFAVPSVAPPLPFAQKA
jgi:hypothetical protein